MKKTIAARGTKEEVHLSPLLSEMLSFWGRQQARSTRGSKRTAPRPPPPLSHFQSLYLAKLAALAQAAGSTRPNVASLPLFVLFGTLLLTSRWQHNAQREAKTSSRKSLRAAWPQLQECRSPTKLATHEGRGGEEKLRRLESEGDYWLKSFLEQNIHSNHKNKLTNAVLP